MSDFTDNSSSESVVLDPTECRIVGTLIEKALATPEGYPLTINALVAGCNQKSNRDPQLSLESFEVEGALTALQIRGVVKLVERLGGRTARYGHRLGERLGLDAPGLAILAELMVRGPQTVNELATRTKRMGATLTAEQVEAKLRTRTEGDAPLFRLTPRRSGERYARWRHLLVAADDDAPARPEVEASPLEPAAAPPPPGPRGTSRPGDDLADRIASLEARVARLEAALGSTAPPSSSPAPSSAAPEGEPASGPEPVPDDANWIDLD